MITIAELFPFYSTGYTWLSVFREITPKEIVRLEKEYTVTTVMTNHTTYKIDEKYHRRDGPAVVMYDGEHVWFELWFRHGKKHRDDGPADIEYDVIDHKPCLFNWYKNGVIVKERGNRITLGDFFKA